MPLLFIRGINLPFGRLVPCAGQVPYALRTRAPVAGGLIAEAPLPLDLHVLGLSLAFILSQDQTLRCMTCFCFSFRACRVAAAGPRLLLVSRLPGPAGRGGGGAVHHVNVRSFRLQFLRLCTSRGGGRFVFEGGCKGSAVSRICKGVGVDFLFEEDALWT